VYFEVSEPGIAPYVSLSIRTEGPDPQYDVYVGVNPMSNLSGVFRGFEHKYGTLPATLVGLPLVAPHLPLKSPETKYGIEINTRVGAYWQNVNLEEVDGKWYMATV
jgi:hypothetical protein